MVGKGWTRLRRIVRQRAGFECEFCSLPENVQKKERDDGQGLHVHHIWPRRYGGENKRGNLIALCDDCHAQIEAKTRHMIKRGKGPEAIIKQRVRYKVAKQRSPDRPGSTNAMMAEMRKLRARGREHPDY